MKRDYRLYIDDIFESIKHVETYSKRLTKPGFKRSVAKQDAIVRRLEIIGEAVKHIPHEIKKKHPEVEWKKMAGARDIFAHGYFMVKLERVWNIVKKDIPVLKKQIKTLLEEVNIKP
ncbi:MAG: DUF86 domain-containing protein [Candidatus Blackburnbacteria bacterium]|nr:DUF86 domain-containing protein [Candidatus Blackburnbacteria bacterium]